MLKLRFHRLSWASFHGTPEFNEIERFCDDASAHMLIEEAMITCNACCSHFLQKQVKEVAIKFVLSIITMLTLKK